MGFANDFGMGHTWILTCDLHGTYLGQHGSHVGYYYMPHMGFANEFGMGPTWVHIWDPRGTYLGLHGSNTGYHYEAHRFCK